jgi:hypothetical protein
MVRKVVVLALLAVVGVTLAGCGPCGFFWDDWRSGKACRSEPAPPK